MTSTYLLLIGAWVIFGCMAVVAWQARRRNRTLDRMIADAQRQRRNDGQSGDRK